SPVTLQLFSHPPLALLVNPTARGHHDHSTARHELHHPHPRGFRLVRHHRLAGSHRLRPRQLRLWRQPRCWCGRQGLIDFSTDTLTYDIYDNSTWVGGADGDGATNSVILDPGVTTFNAISYGWDCNDPSSLRYLIYVEAAGTSFYAYALQ
ncbi:MAG: hypothetical protein ACI8RZ_006803, partial [Myxococcota bacterium]